MIEEYARHNGHADLMRELVDPSSGRPMSLDRCHGLPFEHARGKVDS
jgi:hypothetical protein